MTHESTAAWRELLVTLGGLDSAFLEGDRAVTDDRHIADGYRMLATTLGVRHVSLRRSQPSALGGGQLAVPARPTVGWRQYRRLLLHVPGRPDAALPHQRQ